MSMFSKNRVNFYLVTEKDENQRLDNLLVKLLKEVPKSHIYRIIRNGEVRVNKERKDASYKVSCGDELRMPPLIVNKETSNKKPIPTANFPIIFEDDYFLVINKPDKVACHGGSGISFGVIEQLRAISQPVKFLELAHRLDRDTSGILILAKKRQALIKLQELIRNNQLKKHYLALSVGIWQEGLRKVTVPLVKYLTADGQRRVRVDHQNGQTAQTIFTIIQTFSDFTLVKADIKTGRTHQIRVHLQHLGHPIVGDSKYGNFEVNKQVTKDGFKRMFLHACEVEFIHPITQAKMLLKAELPSNLQEFLNKLTKR